MNKDYITLTAALFCAEENCIVPVSYTPELQALCDFAAAMRGFVSFDTDGGARVQPIVRKPMAYVLRLDTVSDPDMLCFLLGILSQTGGAVAVAHGPEKPDVAELMRECESLDGRVCYHIPPDSPEIFLSGVGMQQVPAPDAPVNDAFYCGALLGLVLPESEYTVDLKERFFHPAVRFAVDALQTYQADLLCSGTMLCFGAKKSNQLWKDYQERKNGGVMHRLQDDRINADDIWN